MGKLRENKLSAWGLKDWDPISARPCVTHSLCHLSQSLPSGSLHKSLIFIHHRADRRNKN